MEQVKIVLGNKKNSSYELIFDILDTDISRKWLVELSEFIDNGQPFDDRERFYNFPQSKYTENYIVDYLNELITVINSYSDGLIERRATVGMTQDTLNYLHHIFEIYHGLYDHQSENEFFSTAPPDVQRALAELNIWIHRYESLWDIPRFVGTWYDKPSRKILDIEDFNYFSLHEEWGDLNINYCEVGKTLHDLYRDEDVYIDPLAFKPLHYYSVDFTVRFTDKSKEHYDSLENNIWDYFDKNKDFFYAHGYSKHDPKLSLGWITVGKIRITEPKNIMIKKIGQHQYIEDIMIVDKNQ